MDINWKRYIHSNPDILVGKPVVRGTRLSVEFLLGLMAKGWSEKQILKNYPNLSADKPQAVFAFATECMREEALFSISKR